MIGCGTAWVTTSSADCSPGWLGSAASDFAGLAALALEGVDLSLLVPEALHHVRVPGDHLALHSDSLLLQLFYLSVEIS